MDLSAQTAARAIEPAVEDVGYTLVDVELKGKGRGRVLRLFIDKPDGGITLDDCQTVSQLISPMLDVEGVVEGQYYLEVSSPGINRRIRKKADFEKFTETEVKIHASSPVDGRRKITGVIQGVDGSDVLIRSKSKGSEKISRVPLAVIDKANLQII